MLSTQPALERKGGSRRTGLALAGGGPLGGIFELGALHALDEAVEGLELTELPVYVGVSSGSFIAASLANAIDTVEMGRIFINNEHEIPLDPELFLRPAVGEYLERAAKIPRLLVAGMWRFARHPFRLTLLETLNPLSEAIPTGVFDNNVLQEFLHRLYTSHARSNDFRQLDCKLYIVATDLNNGKSIKFGRPGFDHVPISKAVEASTALPGLFPPVEIDGSYYVDGALRRTVNASLALDAGADLVLCINPLVPFDASVEEEAAVQIENNTHQNLMEGGLPVVLAQTFRALIQSRMQVAMGKYSTEYPKADLVLIEPDRDDTAMFFTNVFSLRDRQEMVEHAYQTVRRDLLKHAEELEPILKRHGLALKENVLNDRSRSFQSRLEEEHHKLSRSAVANRLDEALDKLQDVLDR